MSSTLKSLRALADQTRLRIIALLEHEELSVNELQEVTRMGQSRISTHLGLLQDSGLLQSRREGKRTFYGLNEQADDVASEFIQLAVRGAREMPEYPADQINLKRVLARRNEQAQVYFNQVAGRFDRSYGPGRSWEAFGHLLLRILPPLTVADLGSGEGLLSELLARRCKKVIAVDNSEKMVTFGANKAKKNGLKNLEFRMGDLENPPIDPSSVDLVILSQALHHAADPGKAIASAYRILQPGGQLMLLDLLQHNFEKARELYGDRWLGFKESDLHRWLETAGFKKIEIQVVAREDQPPHFQTIMAGGENRGSPVVLAPLGSQIQRGEFVTAKCIPCRASVWSAEACLRYRGARQESPRAVPFRHASKKQRRQAAALQTLPRTSPTPSNLAPAHGVRRLASAVGPIVDGNKRPRLGQKSSSTCTRSVLKP